MSVAVVKISANTKKHQTFTKRLSNKAFQVFEKRMKGEDMGIESSCTSTNFLFETLTEETLTVAAFTKTEFEWEESDQTSLFN